MDSYQFYLGIKLNGSDKSYYFSCPDDSFAIGDLVIVSTTQGIEAGTVAVLPKSMDTYNSPLELKPILRKADARDISEHEQNVEDAKRAIVIAEREIAKLGLDMNVIDAFYTHDGSKVTITYTSSEKRVDFRALLPVLAPQLGARLELRQIADRDRARTVGGLGICGLPLCCSTFLNHFEGVGIKQAKNQMLALNIPKLSGPCGKLVCCLAYEDDLYTEAKKNFPRLGTVVNLDEGPYTVHSFNILSNTVQLVNALHSDYKTYSLDDVKAMIKGTYVRPVEIVKSNEEELPSFGIQPAFKEEQKTKQNEQKNAQNGDNRDRNHRHGHGRNRDNNQRRDGNSNNQQNQNNQQRNNQQRGNNNQNRQNNQQRPQQEGGNNNNQRRNNRHRHRPHHGNGGNNGNSGGNA